MNAFKLLRRKVPDNMQSATNNGPSLTRIKRFYKQVEVIEHPIMKTDEDTIKFLDKNEEIGMGNL